MIDVSNLNDALPILMKDDSTFESLKSDFPDILADLVTFRTNPNCSCRGRVVKFFTTKLEESPGVLNKYIKDPNSLNTELQKIKTQRIDNNYSGRILTVSKGDEAWKTFAQEITSGGKYFRAFSVVENGDSLKVYFL